MVYFPLFPRFTAVCSSIRYSHQLQTRLWDGEQRVAGVPPVVATAEHPCPSESTALKTKCTVSDESIQNLKSKI